MPNYQIRMACRSLFNPAMRRPRLFVAPMVLTKLSANNRRSSVARNSGHYPPSLSRRYHTTTCRLQQTLDLPDPSSCKLDWRLLPKVLHGVSTVIKAPSDEVASVLVLFSQQPERPRTASEWHAEAGRELQQSNINVRRLANLTIAIALMVSKSQRQEVASEGELAFVWSLISDVLQSEEMQRYGLRISRSAQGFVNVPLCSVVEDGKIDLLFRLHIWLPDGKRGVPEFAVHSHQPFAQSWILAGKGTDHTYAAEPVATADLATHARYALAWSSGACVSSAYTHSQTYSKVVNTGNFMKAERGRTASHERNMSYSMPAGSLHSSEVSPEMFHATMFLFDGSQGFVEDAPVLGPAKSAEHIQVRDAPEFTPRALSVLVESMRQWEDYLAQSRDHIRKGQWQQAFVVLERAQALCESRLDLEGMSRYKQAVIDEFDLLLSKHDVSDVEEVAKWHYVYGRMLLLSGSHQEALVHFNHHRSISPAVAFCKTSSEHNRQCLRNLASVGANFERADEDGCSALDYAVINGDLEAEAIIVAALRSNLEQKASGEIHQRLREARLRKHFREIYQELVHPTLIGAGDKAISKIRRAYAEALAKDPAKCRAFDPFKYVRYSDLAKHGRLPRSNAGLTRSYCPRTTADDFFLFFSYRWINADPWAREPDDEENTQHQHILRAIERFLALHPSVDPQKLGIWIDFACIDPEHQESGVAALPMLLAQCDAVISVVDDKYYHRAWCNVEVMMIHKLRRTYGVHHWYEFAASSALQQDGKITGLRPGPTDIQVSLKDKLLRFEEDRAKILFLGKQCDLLG
ncbi:hypothetical protein CKM354_000903500 [Cercospora kikuchii]|uniref:Uncharacterized protein n=1 Tax=Cercospora kikuchii TaxID=84275 RepID=A0A9P3FIX6_9PEZI|nr:uncharacterized protein CKM354_000903500 [Cercospora kikuchii]GIZ45887.1 hypothetical protein CKM354_000903500 [Cercospora kikuchii]